MSIEDSNLFYNKSLHENANTLRKTMTKAEACLWKYVLKAKMLNGYQFRRQRPILNYIVDFLCKELKLIIEIDGYTHYDSELYKKDLIRQQQLELYGFKIVRFKDNEVLKNFEGVREQILRVILEINESTPLPPPAGDTIGKSTTCPTSRIQIEF